MSSDQLVGSQDVLNAIMRLRRLGLNRVLSELEHREKALVSHLLEECSLIHTELGKTGATHKQIRRIHSRCLQLSAVLVLALRNGYQRLIDPNDQLLDADPSLDPPLDPPEEGT